LPDKAVEQFAPVLGCASVKAEPELIEVIVQIIAADAALMRTPQPAFQQRRHSMDPRQNHRGLMAAALEDAPSVEVSLLGKGAG